MKLQRKEIVRYELLGVCSGTFHFNSQPKKPTFPKALVAGGTRVDMKKCCLLVDISCNYNFSTCTYWHLQVTRPVGLLMTAALRKGPGLGIAEINSKHNQLSRSQLQQVNFPHILYRKEKSPNGHRTRCSTFLIISGGMLI